MHGLKTRIGLLCALSVFIILALGFEVLPLLSVVTGSFSNDKGTGFTLQQYIKVFTNPFYLQSIWNSILISLISSFVGMIAAVLGAYSLSRFSAKTREKLLMLSNMTSNFAGVPLAFSFIIILGNNGLFTLLFKKFEWNILQAFNLYSSSGLALVYIYFQIPLGILLMYPAFEAVREDWREAALLLGASDLEFWKHIGLPMLFPGITGTFDTLFANSMGAYATAVALTNGSSNLLPIRIGALISGDIYLNPQLAGALSVILGLTLVLVNMVNLKLMKRRGV